MTTITLKPNLVEQIEQMAHTVGIDATALVNDAIQEHITHLRREKLEAEITAFELMHEDLKAQYLGNFVAIHNGQVVDSDEEFESLFLRVREQLGPVPVLIRRVGIKPQTEFRFRSPRLEQIGR
jgi:predicted transcriptional regulator